MTVPSFEEKNGMGVWAPGGLALAEAALGSSFLFPFPRGQTQALFWNLSCS